MKTRFVAAFVLLCAVASPLLADDLVLVDGRYLQVKIQEVNEKGLRVKLLDSGGEVWIPWALVREEDRDRLQVQHGLKEEEQKILESGVRIITKRGDEYFGVPVTKLDAQQLPEEVVIWSGGRKTPIKKSVIRHLEFTEIPAELAYSVAQLYEKKLNEIQPTDDDLEGHWDMAKFAAAVGAYEKAVEHYLKVKEIDEEYEAEYVANHLTRLEEKARNQRFANAIRAAKRKSFYRRFNDALAELDQIMGVESIPPTLKVEAELVKESVAKRRWEYYKKLVRKNYYGFMRIRINKVARDAKMKLKEAQREIRRNLHKGIVQDLADKYKLDPKKEVQKMWEEREIYSTRAASYGSGSFIVLGKAKGAQRRQQQLQRAMMQALNQRNRGGRGGGGRGQQQGGFSAQIAKLPKPPTRDEWWNRADSGSRASWLTAYYAENGKQLTVTGERKYDCGRCGATGTIKFTGGQGETIPVTCPRCQGHRFDKGVAFK